MPSSAILPRTPFEHKARRVPLISTKHRWSSGMIIAFQAVDPGSIPGRCNFFFFVDWAVQVFWWMLELTNSGTTADWFCFAATISC